MDKDICKKWLKNKTINPITKDKLKKRSSTYNLLEKYCIKQRRRKSSKPVLLNDILEPFNKTLKYNVLNRLEYYKILNNYINIINTKYEYNCIRFYKYVNNNPLYRLGNRIILEKRIGTESLYGVVYLSYYKAPKTKNSKSITLGYFAVKVFENIKVNVKEIQILNILTEKALKAVCPHFPISYGTLKCKSFYDKSKYNTSSMSKSILQSKLKTDIPDNFKKYNILFQINELASGDCEHFIKNNNNTELQLNAILQIFISIFFFHNTIQSHHGDTHAGNFLYHIIKPNGYFYYKIYGNEYYIKNMGYLWVIWDFGYTTAYTNNKYLNIKDFEKIYVGLEHYTKNEYIKNTFLPKLNTIIKDPKYSNYNYELIEELQKKLFDLLYNEISSITKEKPKRRELLNKTPYILEEI